MYINARIIKIYLIVLHMSLNLEWSVYKKTNSSVVSGKNHKQKKTLTKLIYSVPLMLCSVITQLRSIACICICNFSKWVITMGSETFNIDYMLIFRCILLCKSLQTIFITSLVFPAGGVCCLGWHVLAHVCHLQVRFVVNNYYVVYLA
jgi:hypothetical protein